MNKISPNGILGQEIKMMGSRSGAVAIVRTCFFRQHQLIQCGFSLRSFHACSSLASSSFVICRNLSSLAGFGDFCASALASNITPT